MFVVDMVEGSCNSAAMPNHPTDLLGTLEAAEVIGVERSVLSRWVTSGRLTSNYRLPTPSGTGALLFLRSEVERCRDEYAANKTKEATS